MRQSGGNERYVVAALFEPIGVGTSFNRRAWPAHVTLAANFRADVAVDAIVHAMRQSGAATEPIETRFSGNALFGRDRDVRVRLVDSARTVSAHTALADRLQRLDGFVAEDAAFWRDGYRAHMTLGATSAGEEGETWSFSSVVLARLREGDAEIVEAFELPG